MSGTKDVHFGSVSRRQHAYFRRVSLLSEKTPRRPIVIDNEPEASGNYLALTKKICPQLPGCGTFIWAFYAWFGFFSMEITSHSEESY